MEARLRKALTQRETDVTGALRRFYGDEALYLACLNDFLQDSTMDELNCAIQKGYWDDAFTAAHALKGLAGNMGFVPLMHAVGQLVVLIRGGRTQLISECMLSVNSSYRDITDAIRENSTPDTNSIKGEGTK